MSVVVRFAASFFIIACSAALTAAPAAAACTGIATFAQLSAIRSNPAGSFCLTKDIAATGNFVPIPELKGTLDGAGHTISNLKINSAAEFVGLFGQIATTGIVRNLNLVGVQVTGTAQQDKVGGLAGYNNGLISNVSLSGVVVGGPPLCDSGTCFGTSVGGMVDSNRGTISNSRVAVTVSKVNGTYGGVGAMAGASSGKIIGSWAAGEVMGRAAAAPAAEKMSSLGAFMSVDSDGGLSWRSSEGLGKAVSNPRSFGGGLVFTVAGTVSQSFSTVRVRNVDNAGGLVGWNTGKISLSFSAGLIDGGTACGGLLSANFPSATPNSVLVSQSYSSTPVVCAGARGGGFVQQTYSKITQAYAIGPVKAAPVGGFSESGDGPTQNGYWDPATTGRSTSSTGQALATNTFKARLPAGFATNAWGIVAGVSYPYLTVFQQRGFVTGGRLFIPVGQGDKFNYTGSELPTYAASASRATGFAVIARAIGINSPTRRVTAGDAKSDYLTNATIDKFWQASSGGIPGPIASLITLGAKTTVAASASLNSSPVVSALKSGKVVLLHGTVTGKPDGHWVLATSFVENSQNVVTKLIAADPFTGGLVGINPTTKRIVGSPAFTLPGFKVDAFQVVTVKP